MVHICMIVNESQSLVMFPIASKIGSIKEGRMEEEGEIDMNSGFYSTDAVFS